jgi:glycosyltransferase involved in cell wall biosynthesis
MKAAVCVIVKNEAKDILEWLAYQFVLGFGTVIVLDNCSTDQTFLVVDAAAKTDDIRLIKWPSQGSGTQRSAYQYVLDTYRVEFEWIAFFDCDEFLVPAEGDDLKSMLARSDGASAIAVNWLIFGSSNHRDFPDGLVIDDFVNRAPLNFAPNHHIKSIVRPEAVKGILNVHQFDVAGRYARPGGEAVEWLRPGRTRDVSASVSQWRIHHYFVRSLAHWQMKMTRSYFGRALRDMTDFDRYDRNDVYDPSARTLSSAVKLHMQKLSPADAACPILVPAPPSALRE